MSNPLLSNPSGQEAVTPETAPKQAFKHPFEPWDPFRASTTSRPGSRAGSRPSSIIAPAAESNSIASPVVSRLSSTSDSYRNHVVSPPASIIAPSTAPPTYSAKSQLFSDPAGLELVAPAGLEFVSPATAPTDSAKSQLFSEPAGLELVSPPTASQSPDGWGPMRKSFHQKIEPAPVSPYSNPNLLEEHKKHMADFGAISKGAPSEKQRKKGLRRPLCILGLIALALVVIGGAVAGAVLGTRKHSNAPVDNNAVMPSNSSTHTAGGTATSSATSAAGTQTNPTATPTVNTNLIKKNSALAVSGERDGDEYKITLYYQGANTNIGASTFDRNSSSAQWSEPRYVTTGGIYTSLASSSFERVPDNDRQYDMFSIGGPSGSTVMEWHLVEGSQEPYYMATRYSSTINSSLAFSWPHLIYQDGRGKVIVCTYDDDHGWGDTLINDIIATVPSGLAIVPRTLDYSSMSIFYQMEDGTLKEYFYDQNASYWKPGATGLKLSPPTNFAAFSAVGNNKTFFNRYLLFQDSSSGDIKMTWIDNYSPGATWHDPIIFIALKGADMGTSIACLTRIDAGKSALVPDDIASELLRCYFQVNGGVREVQYSPSNNEWSILGNVPMG